MGLVISPTIRLASVLMDNSTPSYPSGTVGSLKVGDLVKDSHALENAYNGEAIVWRIADINHKGYPEDSVTLISDKVLFLKCFDAKEPESSNEGHSQYGCSTWYFSNLRAWLNSEESIWYYPNVEQSSSGGADAPPNESNVLNGYNDYENESGFLCNLSKEFKDTILPTEYYTLLCPYGDDSIDISMSPKDKIFIPAEGELGYLSATLTADYIKPLALFKEEYSPYVAGYCNYYCANYCKSSMNLTEGSGCSYWLRDAKPLSFDNRIVNAVDNNILYAMPYDGEIGVRPMCNISAMTVVSSSPDAEGIYSIT